MCAGRTGTPAPTTTVPLKSDFIEPDKWSVVTNSPDPNPAVDCSMWGDHCNRLFVDESFVTDVAYLQEALTTVGDELTVAYLGVGGALGAIPPP